MNNISITTPSSSTGLSITSSSTTTSTIQVRFTFNDRETKIIYIDPASIRNAHARPIDVFKKFFPELWCSHIHVYRQNKGEVDQNGNIIETFKVVHFTQNDLLNEHRKVIKNMPFLLYMGDGKGGERHAISNFLKSKDSIPCTSAVTTVSSTMMSSSSSSSKPEEKKN